MNATLTSALSQSLSPSDVVSIVLALFAGVYAFLWRRDRDPGMGWFALSWSLGAIWFRATPVLHADNPYMVIDGWALALFGVFLTLSVGLVDYLVLGPTLRRRLLWVVLIAGAMYWVMPLFVVLGGLQVRRSIGNLPIAFWYIALGGVAFWAGKREPGAGHCFVAVTLWAIPVLTVLMAAAHVEAPVLRFYAVIPLLVLALTLLTATLLRRRRALEAEVQRRAVAEAEVTSLNTDLEARVQERTAQLLTVNRAEERYRTLAEWTPEAIVVHRAGLVLYANPAMVSLVGARDAQALLGKPILDLVHPDFRERVRSEKITAIGDAAPVPLYQLQLLAFDGTAIDVESRATAITFDGQAATYVVARDITSRLRAEADLHEYRVHLEDLVADRTAALSVAKLAAEAASEAKSSFLANMSHEIRTPMNAIVGMTDLAQRTPDLPPRVSSYLGKIGGAADSLLNIINDILDFSKIESGKLDIQVGEFALQEVLDKVTSLVGEGASRKGLEFLLSTAPGVPRRLMGDSLRLGQVLLNLCSNAIKFTETGEIVVVTVKADSPLPGLTTLRFSVRDTGIGMDAGQIERLFQPFDQLDGSITRKYGGTGLGLAISKQLVEMMGGEIGVRSVAGRGSEFFFTLGFGVVPTVPDAQAGPDWSTLRVLAVDDSANAREIVADLLAGLRCRHAEVESAAAALAELERVATGEAYDLVLIDWKMPVTDGFALARSIRESRLLAVKPRLVLVTAYGDDAVAQRAMREHFDGYLAKPVGASALLATLSTALGRAAPAPAGAGAGSGAAPARLKGCRILLVDDNELNRIVAVDLLGGVAGALVTEAHTGLEALQRLGVGDAAAQASPFDLVLMDVQMPDMDGLEATRRIRAQPALAGLPVLGMTAHALARDRALCMTAGMNEVVTKPFEPSELFEVLAKWLPAVASPAAPEAAAAPGDGQAAVSFELGLSRCLGRHDLYLRVIHRFLDSRRLDAGRLREAHAAGDSTEMAHLAHTTISTAGAIGAASLADIAEHLQEAIRSDQRAAIPALVEAFAHAHQRVVGELRAFVDKG